MREKATNSPNFQRGLGGDFLKVANVVRESLDIANIEKYGRFIGIDIRIEHGMPAKDLERLILYVWFCTQFDLHGLQMYTLSIFFM